MAKAKAVEEAKVSVEMTAEQKEKVVDVLAKDEIKKEEKKEGDEKVAITLRLWHKHNGNPYGPGRVVVPRYLADLLLHNDENAIQGRLKVSVESKHLLQILQDGRSVPIKVREIE